MKVKVKVNTLFHEIIYPNLCPSGLTLASDAELNGVVHLTPDGSVDISGTIKFVIVSLS